MQSIWTEKNGPKKTLVIPEQLRLDVQRFALLLDKKDPRAIAFLAMLDSAENS